MITANLDPKKLINFTAQISVDDEGEIIIRIPFGFHHTEESFALAYTDYKKRKGYCQRTRELIEDIQRAADRWNGETYNKSNWKPYHIIDYPLEETIAVKYPLQGYDDARINFMRSSLLKHNAEVRLVKYVKDGTIACYHFTD